MQCLRPVSIINQARYFDSSTRHRLLMDVPCGQCCNCLQNKSAEWSFRAYSEFIDTVNNGGYVYFDTLTYRDSDLPKLRDFPEFELLPPSRDYMCFSRQHLQLFFSNLRSSLRRKGYKKDVFTYFVGCEYGTDPNRTHRPHYHVLFFVRQSVDPLLFSRLVSDSWHFGRTDGLPYKPKLYVQNNVFRSLVIGSRRVVNYVTKYVQKQSSYMSQVRKRCWSLLWQLANYNPDWFRLKSSKKIKRRLFYLCNQFHIQSNNFGVSAIENIDVEQLYRDGAFVMPGVTGRPVRIPICQYYHRKLCYDVVTMDDGERMWSLKESALPLLVLRNQSLFRSVSNQFRNYVGDRSDDLADYYLNYRGRYRGVFDPPQLLGDILENADRFVYVSSCDKDFYGIRFVSRYYLGHKDSYMPVTDNVSPIAEFIRENVIDDGFIPKFKGFDKIIDEYYKALNDNADNVQNSFDILQRSKELYKSLSYF